MDRDDEDDDLCPLNDDNTGDWVRVRHPAITARSTPADLERVIVAWTEMGLEGLRAQLEEDEDFNFKHRPRDRAAVLVHAAARLEPMIRANVEYMHACMLAVM